MKHLLSLILLGFILFSQKTSAQSSDNEDQVVKIEQKNVRAYRSGQVLVKFKDESDLHVRHEAPGRFHVNANRVKAVNDLLGVTDMEQLMPIGGKKVGG